MNKIYLILIIIVIIIAAVIGYFLYFGNQGANYNTSVSNATNTTPSVNTPVPATTTPNQPANLTATVTIQNFSFTPTPLTIKAGTTVTWTNNDPMPHQIKSATFNSSPLSQGQTFQFTFSSVGSYDYSCAIHPSMLGKIIVTQ